MAYLTKKLSLETSENFIFTNNYLSKKVYNSKSCLKNIKSNKNIKLRLNKKKNLFFNNDSCLKNINKKYIEKNILRNNAFSSAFRQTHSFNKKYYESENEKNNNDNRISLNNMKRSMSLNRSRTLSNEGRDKINCIIDFINFIKELRTS